jgi:hypothetical protein
MKEVEGIFHNKASTSPLLYKMLILKLMQTQGIYRSKQLSPAEP